LTDLQNPNAVAKKEALDRISKGPGFPLDLLVPVLNRDNEEKAVTIMLRLLHNGRETKDMQLSVLKALGQLGGKTKVPASPLIMKLKDKNPDIRRGAIEALAKTKSQEGLPALMQLLDSKRDKYAVIWALGEIGDPAAIPTLDRFLASADPYERYNAQKALAKIGKGKQMGAGSSVAVAGGSGVGPVPTLPFQEREEVLADKASDGRVFGKVLARGANKAIPKRQDARGMTRQTGQVQVQKAGKNDTERVDSLALQRRQLLQTLATQRKFKKETEPAGTDLTKIVPSVSQDAGARQETTNQVLSPDRRKKEKTRKAQQKQGMQERPPSTTAPGALVMAQPALNSQSLDAGMRGSDQASHSQQGSEEETQKGVQVPAGQEAPDTAAILYRNALAYHREGALQEAKKLYEAALEISPNLASAWNNLGTIYMKERNYGEALTVLQRALGIKPDCADPYYNLACLYALQKNVAESLSYLKKAVSVDGEVRKWALTDADLKNLHGHSEYEKIIREAKGLYESPRLIIGQSGLGPQHSKAGKKAWDEASHSEQEGREEAQRVPQVPGAPDEAAILYRNALAYHKEGSLEKAKELYEAALEISPNLASAWNNLGTIYMKERNYGGALRVLQRALRMKPDHADPYYNLACLYALQENVATSLSYLKKAVSVDGEVRKWALTDADLKNLHGHSEYEKIVRETKSS
jgi:tetratricopeptide (TPR) repeat protein